MAPRTSTPHPEPSPQNQHAAPSTQHPEPAPVPGAICVLCGGPNACGVAAGRRECWCFTATVPQALLETLAPEQRNASCICQACIAAFEQQQRRDDGVADQAGRRED